jgi:hypothetical protein
MSATAARGSYPFTSHRTVAQVWREDRDARQMLADLDALSRLRALTDLESRKLERLLRRAA